MSEIIVNSVAEGYSVATVGNLAEFNGKAFVKEVLGTSSMEVSLGSIGAGKSTPFAHHHKQNEEVYIVISGDAEFVLDGRREPVSSGSIVRVSPSVSRAIENKGNELLVYVCIQAKEGSLEQYPITDGVVE